MKKAKPKTIKALIIARGNARILHEAASAAPETRIAAVFDALYKHEYFGEFETDPPTGISRQDWNEMKAEQRTVHRRGENRTPNEKGTTPPPTPNEAVANTERNTNETRTNGDKEKEEEKDRLSLPSVLKGGRERVSGDTPEPSARARSSRFVPPTLEEVKAFWATGGKDGTPLPGNPSRFFYHWESLGWKDGRTPLRNWQARARKWALMENDFAPKNTSQQPSTPKPQPDPFGYPVPRSPEELWGNRSASSYPSTEDAGEKKERR